MVLLLSGCTRNSNVFERLTLCSGDERMDCIFGISSDVNEFELNNIKIYRDKVLSTETEEGLKERTCACGEKETEIIPTTYSIGLKYTLNNSLIKYIPTLGCK